jgi:hypothetical protein
MGKGLGRGKEQNGVSRFDYAAYLQKHFPNHDHSHGLIAAVWHIRKRHSHRYPNPGEVREFAEHKGWLWPKESA